MKLRTLLISTAAAACALLGPAILAQQSQPTPQKVEAVPAPMVAKPAMWKIADSDTTIYLFGTIHLLPAGIEWYDGPVATAFEQSKELVTEIPESSDGQMMNLTLKYGMLPAGQTLREQMTADERTKYESAMTGLGLPPAAFDRFKPWFAALALAILPLQKAGYSMENGIENQLDKRNKALGRPRSGLETLEDQLGIFDGFSPAVQKTYLFSVIDAIPTITTDIDKMVQAWAKGDVEGLAALMNDPTEDPALYEALLSKRNKNWVVWLDKRMDQPGVVFVAVGAGHLGGKDSVQDLLAQGGIKVTRVQ